jgi:hypothetical protein
VEHFDATNPEAGLLKSGEHFTDEVFLNRVGFE